jgi:hypothetical protein
LSIGYGYGPFEGLHAVMVRPNEAVAWLATEPMHKRLVPASLLAFLETAGPCDLPTNQPERTGAPGRPTPQTAEAKLKTEHPLVPEELRDFLEGRAPPAAQATSAEAPISAAAATPDLPARTGPKPRLRKRVEDAMRAAIEKGEMTVVDLKALGQKELPHKFGVNARRTTCAEARNNVLLEFAGV